MAEEILEESFKLQMATDQVIPTVLGNDLVCTMAFQQDVKTKLA